MPLLEMKHITKSFAGVYANEDVDLSVEQGEIHALLGENGAGKTTLMNILFGIYQADRGKSVLKAGMWNLSRRGRRLPGESAWCTSIFPW